MSELNRLVTEYTHQLQQGKIQIAYRGILDFLGKLRAAIMKNHPAFEAGNLYQGRLDMSFFSLSTAVLKRAGLKVVVVYQHESGQFELWLSARNRATVERFGTLAGDVAQGEAAAIPDPDNRDAMVTARLVTEPDFDDPAGLIRIIDQRVGAFVLTVEKSLQNGC